MNLNESGLAGHLSESLSVRWRDSEERLAHFFRGIGLSGAEHSQALYIFPTTPPDVSRYIQELQILAENNERWTVLNCRNEDTRKTTLLAFPVSSKLRSGGTTNKPKKAQLALFIEVHSRLTSWWLVNAWRTQQLAQATWYLGNSLQIIPAASCARSLLETSASFWAETKNLGNLWSEIKREYEANGPNVRFWYKLSGEIYKMVWGAKFDGKVPDLAKTYATFPRTNVLTQIEKLAAATSEPLQKNYQWLCNAVHPSVGGMLAFASPMMLHQAKSVAFQYVCAEPIAFKKIEGGYALIGPGPCGDSMETFREGTIHEALAGAATLAVAVLEKVLDDALRIIDDIALTTGAPRIASFQYWRNIVQKPGALCPCRSGLRSDRCRHRWSDPAPTVVAKF